MKKAPDNPMNRATQPRCSATSKRSGLSARLQPCEAGMFAGSTAHAAALQRAQLMGAIDMVNSHAKQSSSAER